MQRDNLDFKNMSVSKLFTKQLFPTLLGMVSSALFTVVDGIFVGRGIGSDAIAAVNIAAPIFMIAAGLGLMFGMGGGILASINLSRGKLVVANINVTQSIVMLTIVSIIMGILLTVFPETVVTLLGAEGHLTELSAEYLFWFSISIPSTDSFKSSDRTTLWVSVSWASSTNWVYRCISSSSFGSGRYSAVTA